MIGLRLALSSNGMIAVARIADYEGETLSPSLHRCPHLLSVGVPIVNTLASPFLGRWFSTRRRRLLQEHGTITGEIRRNSGSKFCG
jgi:hypothetical protein